MILKREFKWKNLFFQIIKSLRDSALPVVCGFFMLAFSVSNVSAQTRIRGKVIDNTGEAVIGANVIEKGTTNGDVTNINGEFSLSVAVNATVEVSYLGFLPVAFKVEANKTVYDLVLKPDPKSLDEVVVVGYGVLKKKLVTGATIQVSGENIEKLSTPNVFTALQSQSPGVTIMQSNGQPGAGYIANIRGLGTNGESRPLYVIDGVTRGHNALNDMSPADIESIDILKDAASASIYGARSANGVVLITTKQGKVGKTRLSYDGYMGFSYMYKKPDLLNAKEYMMIQDEVRFNTNATPFNWQSLLPKGMYEDIMEGRWNGTDWVDAVYNAGAPTQSHSFNLTGGNEMSKFSMGFSYMKQEGMLGKPLQKEQTRYTFRINSDHVLLKGNGFDAIKIGQTLNYRHNIGLHDMSQGNIYWNAFNGMLKANPLMPIYNKNGGYYDYYDKQSEGWNFDGNFANPIAAFVHSSQGLNLSKGHSLNASAFLEIQPIKNLIFKSQVAYSFGAGSYRDNNRKIRLSNNHNTTVESVSQSQNVGNDWKLDNTLTYNFIKDKHNATIMVGQSIEKGGFGENVGSGGNINIFDLGWDYAWVNNLQPAQLSDRSASGSPYGESRFASFFGRISYNFKETYMATVIMRADGSANFARGHRWGYFPSFSAGWILTNESFLEGLRGTMDFLKLRASWGANGNSNISNFQYLSRYQFRAQDAYYFGTDKVTPSTGAVAGVLKNPDVSWESQVMTDIGFDARFINNKLGVTYSYWVKDTKDWLVTAPISATWGFNAPNMNGGHIQNVGHELQFTWDDRVGDLTYGINLNGTYFSKNEVIKLANAQGIINGSSNLLSQGTGVFTRIQVGYPIGYFYGWKTDGIFQNWDEVNAYKNEEGKLIIPSAQPGDVRFRDIHGKKDANGKDIGPDGKIDEQDKEMIGIGMPKYELGFQINLAYKGFDFIVASHGAFGSNIAKSYRSFADSPNQNYTTDVFNRWTGEGTSNKWPRLTSGSHPNYQQVSDIFVEKGDYLKIQNITLGYDLKKLMPKMPLGQARVYLTVKNLHTFTGYSGMDPEVGFGDGNTWVRGIDVGYYPGSREYLVGVQLTF